MKWIEQDPKINKCTVILSDAAFFALSIAIHMTQSQLNHGS